MTTQPTIVGPIFKEYLKYIEADKSLSGEHDFNIGPRDCLLVIDMQNDFISPHPVYNKTNSRFASSESLDIVEPICALMEEFHSKGATVICSKDYHPWDHCSFMGHTAERFAKRTFQHGTFVGFPAHCVQGTEGANLYGPIRDKLCSLMREDAKTAEQNGIQDPTEVRSQSRAQVCFKGFHEAVDSFGGIEYPANVDMGRFRDVYKKSPCQMSCWTGGCILKCSAQMVCSEMLPEHVDAPPDILAMQFHNKPLPVDQFIRNKNCSRVWVCGLVLDCCVVDTCLNAMQKGFETFMVIDAARPAHVADFGAYGEGDALGFVNPPEEVKRWIQESKLALVPTETLLPKEAMMKLRKFPNVPFADESTGGSWGTKLGPMHGQFPDVFSAIFLAAEHVALKLQVSDMPTASRTGKYDVSKIQEIQALSSFGFKMNGKLSPLSAITLKEDKDKNDVELPSGSVSFAFAYPVDGADNIAKIRASSPQSMQMFALANLSFATFGGYVYFDKDGEVVGCTAFCSANASGWGARSMKAVNGWNDTELVSALHKDGRFQPPVIPQVVDAGAKGFAWVLPGEGKSPSDLGGLVYVFYDLENPPASDSKVAWFPF